ncbi:MAG TPA: hypothetical protein DEH25_16075 [Chloroflexi bacterium]|nr:hypothetical protein [Chloroflexota bacterium]
MATLSKIQLGRISRIRPEHAFNLTIQLALAIDVRLLVCGNRLPFYEIAYTLAGLIGQGYETILRERIFFSRAETGTQLVDFLSKIEADPLPLLVTDLLARFKDEDERQMDELFFAYQVELERLSKAGLVIVSAKPGPPLERLGFALERITHKLDMLELF